MFKVRVLSEGLHEADNHIGSVATSAKPCAIQHKLYTVQRMTVKLRTHTAVAVLTVHARHIAQHFKRNSGCATPAYSLKLKPVHTHHSRTSAYSMLWSLQAWAAEQHTHAHRHTPNAYARTLRMQTTQAHTATRRPGTRIHTALQ